jgi:Ni/Co efflux regulator RcnB
MKKLIILCIALISFSAGFAQDRSKSGHMKDNNERGYHQRMDDHKDRSYSNDRGYNGNDQWMYKRKRQAGMEQANRYRDQRISNYRNDRSLHSSERTRSIYEPQRGGQQQVNSFGKGIVAGAIVGIIAGAILSH